MSNKTWDIKYCYPNTNVLVNKLNITDYRLWSDAEREATFSRSIELESKPIKGIFNAAICKKSFAT